MSRKAPIILVIIALAVALLVYLLRDWKSEARLFHWEFSSRYATIRVSAVGDSTPIFQALRDLEPWARTFTAQFKSDGELDRKIFAAQAGDTLHLDSLSYALFDFALRFRAFSQGDIDVGIGNLLRAWKTAWVQQEPSPPDSLIQQLIVDLKSPFYEMMPQQQALRILKTKHHFALGAFLEGAILVEIERRLRNAQVESYLVEVAGDFAYHGRKPDGSPWTLGVKDPAQPDQLIAIVRTLPDKNSFCTSGDYEQQFSAKDGARSHHIINPHTGYPTQGKHSVSVSTSIPWMNKNTLCTWFMVLPLPEIQRVIEKSQGQVEALLILDSNRIWISPGLRPHTQILLDHYQIVNER